MKSQTQHSQIIFREARTLEELRELLHLRYHTYRASKSARFCPENDLELDIDEFDISARHYGLFMANDIERAIGYVRAVYPLGQFESKITRCLIAGLKRQPNCVSSSNRVVLPLMKYFPEVPALTALLSASRESTATLVEVSRLSLHQTTRSSKLARTFVACGFAALISEYIEYALLTCSPAQKRFYESFGCSQVEGTRDETLPDYNVKKSCLLGSAAGLPSPVREIVHALARQYRREGQISFKLPAAQSITQESLRKVA